MGAGVEFLLDEGSEINIMNVNVYNALKSLKRIEIDQEINWSMRDANQGYSKLVGVCKDCRIMIEGIEVSVPVFISEKTEPQVILGRPWERKTRVLKDNRDDGSLWYTIKDPKSGASATFCAAAKEDSRLFPVKKQQSIASSKNSNTGFFIVNKIDAGWKAISTMPIQLNKDRMTEERWEQLIVGNGNLTELEIEYFKNKLRSVGKVFAFDESEIGTLKEEIEPPIKVHTNEAFKTMKNKLVSADVLKAPMYGENSGKFVLTIDGSPVGAGGVLQQFDNKKNLLYPIRFDSYCFNDRERRYSQIKHELYSIMKMLKKMRIRYSFSDGISKVNSIDKGKPYKIVKDSFETKMKKVKDVLSGEDTSCLNEVKGVIKNYFLCEDVLFKRSKFNRIPRKVVLSELEKKKIVSKIHREEGGGHRGRDATYKKISDRYFWYGIQKDVYDYDRRAPYIHNNTYYFWKVWNRPRSNAKRN
ncbi:hypothetical protein BB558_006410 [Smittium angustum]|uniref:Integrase zinc-binding domain-containing protein n=1 Tax=Smittium angustum TaxID=133377 RepID=A0A2U1IXT8_SMIAN|nr:hypothetical protein BB558_006410 [Smittium angustum]